MLGKRVKKIRIKSLNACGLWTHGFDNVEAGEAIRYSKLAQLGEYGPKFCKFVVLVDKKCWLAVLANVQRVMEEPPQICIVCGDQRAVGRRVVLLL